MRADHPPGQGGNSPPARATLSKYGPSPRAGGKPSHTPRDSAAAGPSPRAGGKLARRRVVKRSRRTIPPGRGETPRLRSRKNYLPDHPPGQGGNVRVGCGLSSCTGPSPRAGGKRPCQSILIRAPRTIPPGRGETARSRRAAKIRADHPPGQGGNGNFFACREREGGPSPRAGGKRSGASSRGKKSRTIPPGRGETIV